jgi:squalene synthase HpnC
MNFDLSEGYSEALRLAKTHYENFPVISFLLPGEIKKHIAIIYWFARTADDIADEGKINSIERIQKLDDVQSRLEALLSGDYNNNLEFALADTINKKKLSSQHFFDLLTAFKQDVTKSRYENFIELINYCKYSANPVGRLILELFDIRDKNLNLLSDKICTALQITNFLQDTLIDYHNGRIYMPQDEMIEYGVREKIFEAEKPDDNFKRLIGFNVNRTQNLFNDGKELIKHLKGGLKIEIDWTVKGGECILEKIRKSDFDVLGKRPSLNKFDYAKIFLKSISHL